MLFRKPDKERDRYYLLAGMGKRLAMKKRRLFLLWSVAAGLIFAALLAAFFYFINSGIPRN